MITLLGKVLALGVLCKSCLTTLQRHTVVPGDANAIEGGAHLTKSKQQRPVFKSCLLSGTKVVMNHYFQINRIFKNVNNYILLKGHE